VAKELIIVMREKPELYASLREEYASHPDIDVIFDRRGGQPSTDSRRDERRTNRELEALRKDGFVRVEVRALDPTAEAFTEIERTGPPTPQQVSGRTFTWTTGINKFPPKVWRELFVDTKDRSIDFSPDKVRFYQSVLIFESEEEKVPTWIQFINGWIRSANERYVKYLEAQERARQAQALLERDPKLRLKEAADRFKNL
jgi:hypothetical protein